MRKILFLFTFFAVAGLFGPASKEAAAQCTHLGGEGACPVGIPNGSTSVSFNADGTINWNSGGVSGPCCAAPSGTETGAGLFNLNNELGRDEFILPPPRPNETDAFLPRSNVVVRDASGRIIINGDNWPVNSCSGSDCTIGPGAAVFGAGPNSGYQCDSGGPGCGNDIWVGLPQPGFGQCGPGGCGGAAPIAPINFADIPGPGRFSRNSTFGDIDPFGGGSSFQDPLTGQSESISDNREEWPDHVKHADELWTAHYNDEIPYPFKDPDWRNKSVEDFKNEPPPGLDNVSRPLEPYSTAGLYDAAPANPGGRQGPQPSSHTVQSGENLFRLALRYGVPVTELAEANGISTNASVFVGQTLTIPTATPVPVESGEATGTTSTSAGSRGPKYSDKAGRFGIGADTTLGSVGGLSARFQVAKNFGVQAIVSFTRTGINDGNENADLTNYVSAFIANTQQGTPPTNFVSVLPVVTPTPAPASTSADADTEEAPEPRSERINLRIGGWNSRSGIDRIDTEGQRTVYRVTTTDGQELDFKSRSDAFFFSDRLNIEGGEKPYNQIVGELPKDRAPINVGPVNTDAVDALTENVPKEFRAPKVNDIRIGEFVIRDPQTGGEIEVKSAQQRDAVLNAMRNGATLEQAAEIAKNAPVVTSSTPAPAGSASTFTNNRPAIIVQPKRPEGTRAGTMKGLLNGKAYDIEVIKTPDGKILAVGTGENANHVFGEVKETSNKLFGDFRREGPWTPPPPASTRQSSTTIAPNTAPRTVPSLAQHSNAQIRSGVANSDRDYMTQPIFTDGFESGNVSQWTTTGP